MEEAFPDELLSAVHIGGLCAMKTISANVMVKSDDPTVRQRNATARDVDFIDVEDWPTRWTYLNGAYKLKGKYPAEEKKLEHSGKLTLAEFLADESDTA